MVQGGGLVPRLVGAPSMGTASNKPFLSSLACILAASFAPSAWAQQPDQPMQWGTPPGPPPVPGQPDPNAPPGQPPPNQPAPGGFGEPGAGTAPGQFGASGQYGGQVSPGQFQNGQFGASGQFGMPGQRP